MALIEKLRRTSLSFLIFVSLILVIGATGTIAHLTAVDSDVNVFALGDVKVELFETPSSEGGVFDNPATDEIENGYCIDRDPDGSWAAIPKDPVLTVKAKSADSYVFVVLKESSTFDQYLSYALAEGWTQLLSDDDGLPVVAKDGGFVYWRAVESSNDDQAFPVFEGNAEYPSGVVTVKTSVTDAQVREIGAKGHSVPELSITAYAVQSMNVGTAFEAWGLLGK